MEAGRGRDRKKRKGTRSSVEGDLSRLLIGDRTPVPSGLTNNRPGRSEEGSGSAPLHPVASCSFCRAACCPFRRHDCATVFELRARIWNGCDERPLSWSDKLSFRTHHFFFRYSLTKHQTFGRSRRRYNRSGFMRFRLFTIHLFSWAFWPTTCLPFE